jgi:hypothetical protein
MRTYLAGRPRVLATSSLCLVATAVACGSGGAPELAGVSDQVAQVGTELQIQLVGTDPDGDDLEYGFRAADLPDLTGRAQVTVSPSGMGVFRWTPLAEDVGPHAFDFTASDGSSTATVTVTIDVKSAIGAATAPIFRSPLGTGTTIDLGTKKCVELQVVVEDQDTAQVTIAQEEPVIEGSTLEQIDGTTAMWSWCPTKEQEAENRRTLVLSADDGDNPKMTKPYLVVLRQPQPANCPGGAPAITHVPQNAETTINLTIDARVTDDKGLKEAPLFYYSETQPANPPNLSQMIQLSTIEIDGTATDAIYAADVPNPVASLPAGTSKTLYYVFVADDDDDEVGNCDHTTISPVFQMKVTSAGPQNAPVCATCSNDAQCGNGDLCVRMGSQSASFCLQSCEGGCPSGYTCSVDPVASVNGATGKQCVPNSGTCEAPTAMCVDDASEENDSRAAASANATANGPLEPGTLDLVSCPKAVQPQSGSKADDDWFQIVVDADAKVDMWLYGDGASDLDLTLYRSNETILSKSTSLEADENIVKCLTPGTYYVKVNGYDPARSEYLLDYVSTPQACNTTCVDDGREDDDTYSQARLATSSTGNKICPGDDDWYKVSVQNGQKITVDMTSTAPGDLDLHLYTTETSEKFPCAPGNSTGCSAANGSGPTANEHLEYTVTGCPASGCTHYVVVRGYDGAENTNYGITIGVQ